MRSSSDARHRARRPRRAPVPANTELLLDCRAAAEQLGAAPPSQEPPAAAAERIAYGVLVAAHEEGLVSTLQHAMDVLKRFSAPAGPLGEQWLREQEKKLL